MDDRSSSAKAMAWVTRITTVSFMMVIPALIGYFIDQWLGTVAVFMFIGVVLGMVCGIYQLVKITKYQSSTSKLTSGQPIAESSDARIDQDENQNR